MDTSQLKKYAVQARRDFRDAVSARAKRIGVSGASVQQYTVQGDLLIIGEQTFPKQYKSAFDALYREVAAKGFERVIDETAYTWFNRFVALRFMELHDYFPHGLRVLSSTDEDPTPQILRNPAQLNFTHSFNKKSAQELFEAGNKEEELYRMVLIAQCNELNSIMPFLFERVSDLSEILLPDNLLASDSIIRKLVSEIEESEWSTGVEIIGWIYQYYISEKKDEVIGKLVKSEDIPAATQLFTPNWIVKYLVQNSVGSYWLGIYPDSPLTSKLEYYIKPAEQESEVLAELKKITPSELNPESITVLDPACGSGHILVEAYDILKEIYLERGYRPREIPRLILEKNLFGLDIDGRASQLASFALLMKARADDRAIFSSDHPIRLNILEIIETDFSIEEAVQSLTKGKSVSIEQVEMPFMAKPTQTQLSLAAPGTLSPTELREFLELFKQAKTLGSLITIPNSLEGKVAGISSIAEKLKKSGDIFEQMYGRRVLRLCEQARLLGGQFDAVITNPPYMGGKGINRDLGTYLKRYYSAGKLDLYSSFILRGMTFQKENGFVAMVTMQAWLFLSSMCALRKEILSREWISSLVQIGYNSFPEMNSKIARAAAFVLQSSNKANRRGVYVNLNDAPQAADKDLVYRERIPNKKVYAVDQNTFSIIDGNPIAYWLSPRMMALFKNGTKLRDLVEPKAGMSTTDNEQFLRRWWEVDRSNSATPETAIAQANSCKWFPYNKGGPYRKWYGNFEYVVNWRNHGEDIRKAIAADPAKQVGGRLVNTELFFKEGVTWSAISSTDISPRYLPPGYIFDSKGPALFTDDGALQCLLMAGMASNVWSEALKILAPTLDFNPGALGNIPVVWPESKATIQKLVHNAITLCRLDWDSSELSWDFSLHPVLNLSEPQTASLTDSYSAFIKASNDTEATLKQIETELNVMFVHAANLDKELSLEVPNNHIVIRRANRAEDVAQILSYALGCILGRYSLDQPGLIYANSGNLGFDHSRYTKLPADSDGVVPILDYHWFSDDVTTRFREFLIACWNADSLEENMKFIADSLEPKRGETPEETIRRYFCDSFFKYHLKMYKKRPIYWLFSSGKEKAFQAIVYLHRYNEQTLSKMRTDYVLPLQGKMANEEKRLDSQAENSASPAERSRYIKELEKLTKKQAELRKFDELLHHYADKRISLDLDDGVQVNYGKFGALLAEVKQVTGGNDEG